MVSAFHPSDRAIARWRDQAVRLQILSSHHEDQLRAVMEDIALLGGLSGTEADAPLDARLDRLYRLEREHEAAMTKADVGVARALCRIDCLTDEQAQD